MTTILLSLAIVSLLLGALAGADFAVGNRSIQSLADASPQSSPDSPKLSVLIPARNEERNIREALQSVLKQDYPYAEYIVLNDRSTDGTGTILAEMSRQYPRLRVVEISELPRGWLGKNYALFRGAEAAGGDLLLFADADIVMDPSVFGRAVNYMREHHLDHLTIMPEVRMPGVLLRMFTSSFGVFFSMYARPWKAKDPKSRSFVGIGAFNLIRAEAYRASGTHQAIAMRPDDDLKLGKLLKRSGYRQEMIFGVGLLSVEWYASLGEVIDGLMKNSFAGVGYSLMASIVAGIAVLVFHVWPFVAVFCTHGPVRMLNLLLAVMILLLVADGNRVYGLRAWYAIGHPLCSVLFVYILWRSTATTLWNNGITWRGTHYPLRLLRANKV